MGKHQVDLQGYTSGFVFVAVSLASVRKAHLCVSFFVSNLLSGTFLSANLM
jgi:hypothetical protein